MKNSIIARDQDELAGHRDVAAHAGVGLKTPLDHGIADRPANGGTAVRGVAAEPRPSVRLGLTTKQQGSH